MSDTNQAPKSGFRLWMLIPPVAAIVVLVLMLMQLGNERSSVLPSALIGKPVPTFDLPGLETPDKGLKTEDMTGNGVQLINIWASWCGPCRVEHPQLLALKADGVKLHGINYKDQPDNARRFLSELGDPYDRIGADQAGRAAFDFGVYGVPETFVVNNDGQIVYKHVGPLLPRDIDQKLMPAIREASGE